MSTPLETVHFHVADSTRPAEASRRPAAADGDTPAASFTSDEAAARYYLDGLLREDDRAGMRSIAEPERPGYVPSLVVEAQRDVPVLNTRQVRFAQTHRGVPVFGSAAVVELTGARDLVSVNAQLEEVSGVDPVESISRTEAVQYVATHTGTALPAEVAEGGRLVYVKDDDGRWHLAWQLLSVPALPPEDDDPDPDPVDAALLGHGLGRRGPVAVDYLVDAHDGAILWQYSAVPTVLPTRCRGVDENGDTQTFLGSVVEPGGGDQIALVDPLRSVRTHDRELTDISDPPLLHGDPVHATGSDFGTTNRAAVSAHVNAARVHDFYQSVLQRDSVDDQGMALVSQVNVTDRDQQAPPELLNAFWWQQMMWYGQTTKDGRLVSLSRYLDVIAHELTHGVVETTSGLLYQVQSGALNESICDVIGVIVNNHPSGVGTWNWELGSGLRPDGRPLRDLSDPARLGYPDHMKDFRALRPGELPSSRNDWGWVHYNSSITNKAAHNLLTIRQDGKLVFGVEDVSLLLYLGTARLTSTATFTQLLQSVVDVAQTYFAGDAERPVKIAAIRQAYGDVGIV